VKAYDGPQIVGMDLHRRHSVLVRMTPDGKRLDKVQITNSPEELRREIALAGEHPKVVLETTYGCTGRRARWRKLVPGCTWRTRSG
jgi:hypothetical protein